MTSARVIATPLTLPPILVPMRAPLSALGLAMLVGLGCGQGESSGTRAAGSGGASSSSTASSASSASSGGAVEGSAGGSGGAGGQIAGAGGDGGTGGAGGTTTDPGTEGDGDYTIDPAYEAAPESRVADGVPRGTLRSFELPSRVSAIYPRDVGSGREFERRVQLYIPDGYVSGTEAPFIIVQDGSGYVGRLQPVLDNMIHDGRLPKLIGVFINPGPGDGPGSQRGLEYDTVSDRYVTFIETEILPKLEDDYDVKFTDDPEGRASMGCSSGGAAAFTMGWFRPELYRRILTYSGTFVNQAPSDDYPHGAWEYHENLIPGSERKPLRVFLEVGEDDLNSRGPASDHHNWVLANQFMARELAAKGYHHRFIFARGARHCDGGVIAQTLPETLLWLWRGYPR
ncbi:alpha/beta hydrolase-fold protein [Sorangium sp. So ce136]|uniref:alpha/beta hydrolase n=1 Tax=Sorangium sp. So ce136 TaxID=3133284 RepID=UPI003F10804F